MRACLPEIAPADLAHPKEKVGIGSERCVEGTEKRASTTRIRTSRRSTRREDRVAHLGGGAPRLVTPNPGRTALPVGCARPELADAAGGKEGGAAACVSGSGVQEWRPRLDLPLEARMEGGEEESAGVEWGDG
jgi:hypothetical protein